MGLDMYLNAEKFFWTKDAEKVAKLAEIFPEFKDKNFRSISIELGYWRKANAIHKWFVERLQDGNDDCRSTLVDVKVLEELLDLVNRVLANKKLAQELLPTTSGFFFGSTEYDEWYDLDLVNTKQICEDAIKFINDNDLCDVYYRSSW